MRVMVIGASKVGFALVKQLCREGADVIVIDKDPKKIDAITDAFDCNGYVGNGSNAELLKKSGIDSTSLFIAVTKEDESNLLCCSVAKKLGVKKTVAAVDNPDFDAHDEFFRDLGIDVFINPHKAAAMEVSRKIHYDSELELEFFDDGAVKIATVQIDADNILAGSSMLEVKEKLGGNVLVCAILRKGKTVPPNGKQQIHAGDRVTFLAVDNDMDTALAAIGISDKVLKKVVIVGGGKIGYYLADILKKQGVKITLIDNKERRCKELSELLPNTDILLGDGTDSEFMEHALKGAHACVSVTGNDEENLVISMFAKSFGLNRIAAEIDNENFEIMLKKSGINHTFSTQNMAIDRIIRSVRTIAIDDNKDDTNNIRKLHYINGGLTESIEFEISGDFPLLHIPFKDPGFKLQPGVLIALIMRNKETIVPDGNSCIIPGDRIIVISSDKKITKIADIFA